MSTPDPDPPPPPASSRCWTLHTSGGAIDVELWARDDERLGPVRHALEAALGEPVPQLWHGSRALADGLELDAEELAHGSVLGVGRPGPRAPAWTGPSALELQATGGPQAGGRWPIGHGDHVVGRGGGADVALDDPDVSRRHLLVRVRTGAITVADLGSTNGTTLDGTPLTDRAREWPLGSVARTGASSLVLAGPDGYPARTEPAPGGRTVLRPHPRIPTGRAQVEVEFPAEPVDSPRRRLAWLPVALPAVGGVLMAVVLHTPNFLFFALLSPLMGVGTWLSERVSGRRSRRRDLAAHRLATRAAEEKLAAAVRAETRGLDAAAPHLAALTSAAARRTHLLWSRRATDPDALTVRLGIGPGPTSVIRVGPGSSRVPVTSPHLPVALDLREYRALGVIGPRPFAMDVLAGLVTQLAILHPPGEVELLLLVSPDTVADWRWARWLPHLRPGDVRITARPTTEGGEPDRVLADLLRRRRAASGDGSAAAARAGWSVVVVDGPLPPSTAAALRDAGEHGVVTLVLAGSAQAPPLPLTASLTLCGETGERAVLRRSGVAGPATLTADRLPRRLAAAAARDLAPLCPPVPATDLPARIRLLELPHSGLRWVDGELRGDWSRDRSCLAASVGRTATGPLEVDLCRLGPHALVAGTTGSGKSEFLQSLIAGLALAHPPDRCSFLLVDYKGGAAFAEAAALPHAVGMLTDLDGRSTERALRSLTAELLRRESLLAEHQVADVAALPDDVDLARLVIVVDEFATLAEELPDFVPGLVGIAQRGRSLGVHLVLATQRPAGVVSPEIRANCTLRICLRTTDEGDSRDVLGLPHAAHLPIDRPGRAYLRAGAGAPTLFQVARVAENTAGTDEESVRVAPWLWPVGPAPEAERRTGNGESDLARLCTAVRRHGALTGGSAPHRPWCPPLPDRLSAVALDAAAPFVPSTADPRRAAARLRIGLIDRPDIQAWEYLELDLSAGGGWLAVGAGRSGRTTLLRSVLAEAARELGPDGVHVHVIDHGGGTLATEAGALPHTGTTVGADDPLRTVRLLARLGEEVAVRRAGTGPEPSPLLLLLVDGVESVLEQLDEHDPGGSSGFLRLVRDGAAAGLTCVLTAERAVPGGRLAASVRQRLVLPLTDKADYVVAGVPAAAIPATRSPGRALLGEASLECQLALPRPLDSTVTGAARGTALRIPPLPDHPVLRLPAPGDPAEAIATGVLRLPIGPGGDEGAVLHVDLVRSGGLLVAGPPRSGRSSALAAFAEHLAALELPVARLGPSHAFPATAATVAGAVLDPEDDVGFAAWLARLDGEPGAVVVDDLDLLADSPAIRRLSDRGAAAGVILLAAAGAADLARQFHGPVAALRRQRTALLLRPAPGDAEVLGVRLPRSPLPRRPGSGWLVRAGAVERVQVARRIPASAHRAVAAQALIRQPA